MFDIAEKSELSWLSSLESPAVRIQNQRLYAPLLNVSEAVNICRVGQNNRVCTPSMTVCMVISLLMILYIRMYGFGHLHNICSPTDWLINSALIMPGLRKAVSAPAACSCHTHTHTHTQTHKHTHTHTHTRTHTHNTHTQLELRPVYMQHPCGSAQPQQPPAHLPMQNSQGPPSYLELTCNDLVRGVARDVG